MQRFLQYPPTHFEEHLQERLVAWSILNGNAIPFERDLYYTIHRDFLERLHQPESFTNHLLAIQNSFDMVQAVPYYIQVPTVIIH